MSKVILIGGWVNLSGGVGDGVEILVEGLWKKGSLQILDQMPDVGVSATDLNDRIPRSLPFIYLNPEKGTPFVWNFLI